MFQVVDRVEAAGGEVAVGPVRAQHKRRAGQGRAEPEAGLGGEHVSGRAVGVALLGDEAGVKFLYDRAFEKFQPRAAAQHLPEREGVRPGKFRVVGGGSVRVQGTLITK